MSIYQDVDAMWEADAAAEWERPNSPDPYEKVLKSAAIDLEAVRIAFEPLLDRMSDVSATLTETPMQAKIDSFIETLEDIKYDLWSIKLHWERGERE
jgi:hypothetical protein